MNEINKYRRSRAISKLPQSSCPFWCKRISLIWLPDGAKRRCCTLGLLNTILFKFPNLIMNLESSNYSSSPKEWQGSQEKPSCMENLNLYYWCADIVQNLNEVIKTAKVWKPTNPFLTFFSTLFIFAILGAGWIVEWKEFRWKVPVCAGVALQSGRRNLRSFQENGLDLMGF